MILLQPSAITGATCPTMQHGSLLQTRGESRSEEDHDFLEDCGHFTAKRVIVVDFISHT
jgi:hypothetical protein